MADNAIALDSAVLEDGVLTVTLPLSPDGLLSLAACDELSALLTSPPDTAHVLVIRSAGEAFCLAGSGPPPRSTTSPVRSTD